MRVPSENSNADYSLVTFLKMNYFYIMIKEGTLECHYLCIHRQQKSEPSTVTLMLPNALKATLARIGLYPITVFRIIVSKKLC